jgi:single-strand DNA-binding protein
MNNVSLAGRMTRDCELKYTQEGKAIGNFTIAINKRYKKDEANFINCVAFGKTAELISEYVRKGHLFGITGSIETSSWEKDGQKHYKTEVAVDQITFLQSKGEGVTNTTNTTANTVTKSEDTEEFPF